jgi:hypothetical protein
MTVIAGRLIAGARMPAGRNADNLLSRLAVPAPFKSQYPAALAAGSSAKFTDAVRLGSSLQALATASAYYTLYGWFSADLNVKASGTFVGSIAGTELTVTSGAAVVGEVISGAGVTLGTTIQSYSATTGKFTVYPSQTVASTTFTATPLAVALYGVGPTGTVLSPMFGGIPTATLGAGANAREALNIAGSTGSGGSGTGQVASFRGVLPNLDGSAGYRVAIAGIFAQALGERYLVGLLGVGGATMGAFGIVNSKIGAVARRTSADAALQLTSSVAVSGNRVIAVFSVDPVAGTLTIHVDGVLAGTIALATSGAKVDFGSAATIVIGNLGSSGARAGVVTDVVVAPLTTSEATLRMALLLANPS